MVAAGVEGVWGSVGGAVCGDGGVGRGDAYRGLLALPTRRHRGVADRGGLRLPRRRHHPPPLTNLARQCHGRLGRTKGARTQMARYSL